MTTATTEVHIAIYDLSMGMAKHLSAQFLGPQHAIDIIPHTAIVAFGKEYFFGRGIEWCHPQEFRLTRGIHPIEILSLGHTSRSQTEFEEWCTAQGRPNGRFTITSYDLLSRNCNNFTEEAAREGLRLGKGVPSWILEVPQKFLSSPMGVMVRPLLEGMQMTNNAPTNVTHQFNNARSSPPATSAATAAAANPWLNISETFSPPKESKCIWLPAETPFLDKQTALLSRDTGVVKICIERLAPSSDQQEILSKLGYDKYSWTTAELQFVHRILRSFISEVKQVSFALMLLRLVVLRESSTGDTNIDEEQSRSTEFVTDLLLENKLVGSSNRSMAWCVLSNAIGSKQLPTWTSSEEGNSQSSKFLQLIDGAVNDCDPSSTDASASPQKLLRQSACAFLYNTACQLTISNNDDSTNGNGELTEAIMSILIGCLENLGRETDSTCITRRYMCIGKILASRNFGKTAVGLVKDLGLGMIGTDEIGNMSNDKDVQQLSKEVASLLSFE
jgi:hypothetical protein